MIKTKHPALLGGWTIPPTTKVVGISPNLLEVLRKTDFVLLDQQWLVVDSLASAGLCQEIGEKKEQEDDLESLANFFYSLMVAAGKDGLPVPEWVNPPKNQ